MTEQIDDYVGTAPTRAQHRFDEPKLEAYLHERLPGFAGPLSVEQFKGGQSNPTYRLNARSQRYVLRRKPPGKLQPSAHAVDREYRVMSALGDTDFPVPRTHLLCEDDSIIGTPFYVMDYVDGRIFWNQSLPGMSRTARAAIYDEMNRVIANLHSIDYAAIGLAEYGRPGNYFARQIKRWSDQYKVTETEPMPAMENLIAWLPQNMPPDGETSLVHGDFRLDNLVFDPTEPRVLAVLDWELSTLGHPLADFAYHCMSWHIDPQRFRGIAGLDLEALGIPSEHEYVARYCERTGRDRIENFGFYLAFSFFRISAILQGIMKRVIDGTASSAQAADAGKRARPMAELGWQCAQRASIQS